MQVFSEQDVREALPWSGLIPELRKAFISGCTQPLRSSHQIEVPGEPDASFLMMPAWDVGGKLAVKILFISPGNTKRNLPAVNASVVVFDAVTGAPEAVLEGGELTARRTAATSALAADYLARQDAKNLLIVGAGTIAANLVPAHCSVRNYESVKVWARDPAKAAAFSESIDVEVLVATDLDDAVSEADVIATATLSNDPLIKGRLLKKGAHLDLVGGYLPTMREADTDAIRRAVGGIVVDTYEGAMAEAGDLTQPLEAGDITQKDIIGDLAELCRGNFVGRTDENQITLFKSVGAAIEDFAAARMAVTSDQ